MLVSMSFLAMLIPRAPCWVMQ